jgi:hypothetical protein
MADKDRSGHPKRPHPKNKKQSTENKATADTHPVPPPIVHAEPAIEEQIVHEMTNGKESIAEKKGRIAEKTEGVSDRASYVVGRAQHLVAEYINASEAYAIKLIELQYCAGGWARRTPLKPIIEAQNTLTRKMVEISARAARAALRIQAPG